MNWQTAASIVGAVAGITGMVTGALALYVSWRVYRRQVLADLPVVTADVTPHSPNWWEVTVTVENRSRAEWQTEQMSVRRPFGAKIIHRYRAVVPDEAEPWKPGALVLPDPATMSKRVRPGIRVLPEGDGSSRPVFMGTSDRHSVTFLLHASPSFWRGRRLSLRLSLSSNESIHRRSTKTITRQLIDARSMPT